MAIENLSYTHLNVAYFWMSKYPINYSEILFTYLNPGDSVKL